MAQAEARFACELPVYCRGRQIDTDLDRFLDATDEYNHVASLFCPPRTGKTTSVREAANEKKFRLAYFSHGKLLKLLDKMTAVGSGRYAEFRDATAGKISLADLGVDDESERVLFHLDEAQLWISGIKTFRDAAFDFQNAPRAAQLAALVRNVRVWCCAHRRCVVSGTAVNAVDILNLDSVNKTRTLSILPTDENFVRAVLQSQPPSITVTDAQARELCGHVGQLYWVYIAYCDAGELDLTSAFRRWFDESSQRLHWDLNTALNVSLLVARLPNPDARGLIEIDDKSKRLPAVEGLLADGAWATVLFVDRKLFLARLSPWQQRALDTLYEANGTRLKHAFITTGSAKENDPDKLKGHVFQMMFALELGSLDSPLWGALGEEPVSFDDFQRFDEKTNFKERVIYVVTESPTRKLGDVVWRSGGRLVAAELKCGTDEYVGTEFRKYNDRLAAKELPTNVKDVFVSCSDVRFLTQPTVAPLKADGTVDLRFKPVSAVRCDRIVNNARIYATRFTLHPELTDNGWEFAQNITRTPSAADRVANHLDNFVTGTKRGRKSVPLQVPLQVMVTDGNVTFRVKPEDSLVMDLKAAIMPEWVPHKAAEIIIRNPSGNVLRDEDVISGAVKYTYALPPQAAAG